MPNVIVGLKYQSPIKEPVTEQQLLDVFYDLRVVYNDFVMNFRIEDQDGQMVSDFKDFLYHATGKRPKLGSDEKPAVILIGSGDIGGLVVKDASVEFDLSAVKGLTEYWDIRCNIDSCYSCNYLATRLLSQDESENYCKAGKGDFVKPKDCSDYKPKRTNAEGKAARRLVELIEEAAAKQ